MGQVVFRPKAEEDLYTIWEYIAIENQNRLNADRFIDKIEAQLFRLAKNPMMGVSRAEQKPNLRGWPYKKYMIYYYPKNNGIEVSRILSSYMDVEQLDF